MSTPVADKLVTVAGLGEAFRVKLDKDFTGLTAAPSGVQDTDLIALRRPSANSGAGENYKIPMSDIKATPFVVEIPASQWNGTGPYYVQVTSSAITANSILTITCDEDGAEYVTGGLWCVPSAGSFQIRTNSIPGGTITAYVFLQGVLGEAQYIVLPDCYTKNESDSKFVPKTDVVNNLTSGGTTVPLSAEMGKTIAGKIINSSSGTYVKFADGTLICYDIVTNFTFNANTTTTKTYSFGQSFTYAPTVITGINTTIPDKLILSTYGVTTSGFTLNGVSSFSANQTPTVYVIAIGRWK